jgi:hypothetical protein
VTCSLYYGSVDGSGPSIHFGGQTRLARLAPRCSRGSRLRGRSSPPATVLAVREHHAGSRGAPRGRLRRPLFAIKPRRPFSAREGDDSVGALVGDRAVCVAQRSCGILPVENRERSTFLDQKGGVGAIPSWRAQVAARNSVNASSRSGAAGARVREGGIRRLDGRIVQPGLPAEVDARDRPSTELNAQREKCRSLDSLRSLGMTGLVPTGGWPRAPPPSTPCSAPSSPRGLPAHPPG